MDATKGVLKGKKEPEVGCCEECYTIVSLSRRDDGTIQLPQYCPACGSTKLRQLVFKPV